MFQHFSSYATFFPFPNPIWLDIRNIFNISRLLQLFSTSVIFLVTFQHFFDFFTIFRLLQYFSTFWIFFNIFWLSQHFNLFRLLQHLATCFNFCNIFDSISRIFQHLSTLPIFCNIFPIKQECIIFTHRPLLLAIKRSFLFHVILKLKDIRYV